MLPNDISKMSLATWPLCASSHVVPLRLSSLHLSFSSILTCHWWMATFYLSNVFHQRCIFLLICMDHQIFWNHITAVQTFCYLNINNRLPFRDICMGLSSWLVCVRGIIPFFFSRCSSHSCLLFCFTDIIPTYSLISCICYH